MAGSVRSYPHRRETALHRDTERKLLDIVDAIHAMTIGGVLFSVYFGAWINAQHGRVEHILRNMVSVAMAGQDWKTADQTEAEIFELIANEFTPDM